MSEETSIKRLRESHKRFAELEKEFELLLQAYRAYRDTFGARLREVNASEEPQAFDEFMRANDEENMRWEKRIDAKLAELRKTTEEIVAIGMEAEVEGSKLRSEALKHQATISAGAIVGLATITQVVMPSDLNATLLLWATYAVLLLTVSISVLLMHVEALRVESILGTGESPFLQGWERVYKATSLGLPVAVALFLIFQLFNDLA